MELNDIIEDFLLEEDQEVYENARKERVVKPRPNHFEDWECNEFFRRFRLTKYSCQYLCSLIENQLAYATDRNQAVPVMQQLLICLRFYATGSFYITIGDFSSLHKSTVCRIITRVTKAIASLRSQFINLPSNGEILKIQEEFYNIARFPRVVSALDCTHVRIISPGGSTAENFRNRKGYFSINVQAMCSAKLKFQNIVARWPGCTHDTMIFLNSAAKYTFDNGTFERLFNEAHIRTRNVIERCFGVWKRRFPVLGIGMRCRIPLVQDIIVAAAVLHNIAIDMKEDKPPEDPELSTQLEEETENMEPVIGDSSEARNVILEYFESLI
ncbi:PREDICTED: putative nuclease HARBI1 isoform X2 [Rhagoletis zephyria]|uniref:putative nuclease HARBI1 isoform X2 n=1 Tax=Rhagoletis zephyria TaxID=28612 RepID=UPI0008116B9E|nr:PREDICTED: putative nuclease HARBI1 isoform X2 [Rhagoletis zephyria]